MNDKSFLEKESSLREEIEEISSRLHNLGEEDDHLRYENLKSYRDEMLRGFILYTHLSIEDLLRALTFRTLSDNKAFSDDELIKFIHDTKSSDLIYWSAVLGVIPRKEFDLLIKLNKLRNTASHNWFLSSSNSIKEKRFPKLLFDGKNLLEKNVFFEEFMPTYTKIYLDLFMRYYDR